MTKITNLPTLNSAVIDLETLDIQPSAAILTAGIHLFDINQINDIKTLDGHGNTTHIHLEIREQLLIHGRTTDRRHSNNTLDWWAEQDKQAKAALFTNANSYESLESALAIIHSLVMDKDVYFRGTDFDGSILEHAYQQTGQPCPWKYNQKNDIRTYIKAKTNSKKGYIDGLEKPDWMIPHRADHDAVWDAYQLQIATNPDSLTVENQG